VEAIFWNIQRGKHDPLEKISEDVFGLMLMHPDIIILSEALDGLERTLAQTLPQDWEVVNFPANVNNYALATSLRYVCLRRRAPAGAAPLVNAQLLARPPGNARPSVAFWLANHQDSIFIAIHTPPPPFRRPNDVQLQAAAIAFAYTDCQTRLQHAPLGIFGDLNVDVSGAGYQVPFLNLIIAMAGHGGPAGYLRCAPVRHTWIRRDRTGRVLDSKTLDWALVSAQVQNPSCQVIRVMDDPAINPQRMRGREDEEWGRGGFFKGVKRSDHLPIRFRA
jgi:hypothetical protein